MVGRLFLKILPWALLSLVSLPLYAGVVQVSRAGITLGFDADKGYCLKYVEWNGIHFAGGSQNPFPQFCMLRISNPPTYTQQEMLTPESAKFVRKLTGAVVRYIFDGIEIEVEYRISCRRVYVEIRPYERGRGFEIVNVGAEELFLVEDPSWCLLTPYQQGSTIRLDSQNVWEKDWSWFMDWMYPANFWAILAPKGGLIFHPLTYSARFRWGRKIIDGKDSIFAGCELGFRPFNTHLPTIRLCHDRLAFELIFFTDYNGDGEVNWVDAGILYRDMAIKPNKHIDEGLRESITGKVWPRVPDTGGKTQYEWMLDRMKEIFYAPQVWWVVGAHTDMRQGFCNPVYSSGPHPKHGDFFRFRDEARKYNIRIGIHEIFAEVNENEPDWGPAILRETPEGFLWKMPWGDEGHKSTAKALPALVASGVFFGELYKHIVEDWRTQPGDTWHWDVFTTGALEDYRPDFPATLDMDYRARYAILKYLNEVLGVKITSEGLVEYLAEQCNISWWTLMDPPLYSRFHTPSLFNNMEAIKRFGDKHNYGQLPEQIRGEQVPLTPLLFLGNTYYSWISEQKPWIDRGVALLYGMKFLTEFFHGQIDEKLLRERYFRQNLFWAQICDLHVQDIDFDGKTWQVLYSDGSKFYLDATTHKYALYKDGFPYKTISPANSWGYMGIWKDEDEPTDNRWLLPQNYLCEGVTIEGENILEGGRVYFAPKHFLSEDATEILKKTPFKLIADIPVACAVRQREGAYLIDLHPSSSRGWVTIKADIRTRWYDKEGRFLKQGRNLRVLLEQDIRLEAVPVSP